MSIERTINAHGKYSRPNDQSSSNGASDSNHSNLSCFQPSVEMVMGIFVEVPRIGNIDIVLPLHRVRIVVLLLDSCHLDGRLFLSQLTHRNQVSQESKKQQAPSL